MFGQAKDLYAMQKQAKKLKKELANLHIEAEVDGIIVTISGEQEVIDVKIPEEMKNSTELGEKLKTAFNKGIKKSQEVAAERMRDLMGGLNIPGLTGGDNPGA